MGGIIPPGMPYHYGIGMKPILRSRAPFPLAMPVTQAAPAPVTMEAPAPAPAAREKDCGCGKTKRVRPDLSRREDTPR
jgi:hypothetical protein